MQESTVRINKIRYINSAIVVSPVPATPNAPLLYSLSPYLLPLCSDFFTDLVFSVFTPQDPGRPIVSVTSCARGPFVLFCLPLFFCVTLAFTVLIPYPHVVLRIRVPPPASLSRSYFAQPSSRSSLLRCHLDASVNPCYVHMRGWYAFFSQHFP